MDNSLENLAKACKDEFLSFMKENIKQSPACYELFQQALEQSNHEAFRLIFNIYQNQVEKWIYQHSYYQETQQPVDFFVNWAYSSFYFALRGKSLEKNFSSVAHLLAYLKTCIHTAIMQHLRKLERIIDIPIDETYPAKTTASNDQAEELWERMCNLVTDKQDQLLMRLIFIEEYKPAEVTKLHPHHWQNARQVSVSLYRIRTILRRDEIIRRIAGLD